MQRCPSDKAPNPYHQTGPERRSPSCARPSGTRTSLRHRAGQGPSRKRPEARGKSEARNGKYAVISNTTRMAEGEGFEPSVRFVTVQRFSKPPPSTTRPSLPPGESTVGRSTRRRQRRVRHQAPPLRRKGLRPFNLSAVTTSNTWMARPSRAMTQRNRAAPPVGGRCRAEPSNRIRHAPLGRAIHVFTSVLVPTLQHNRTRRRCSPEPAPAKAGASMMP